MDCDDERKAVIYFRQDSTEMAVPRVTMNDVCVDLGCIEIGAASHRTKNGTQRLRAGESGCVELESLHAKISRLESLISKTANFDWHRLRQLA
jgi:hypothetical protein